MSNGRGQVPVLSGTGKTGRRVVAELCELTGLRSLTFADAADEISAAAATGVWDVR
jgi:hypothetical protein